MKDDKLKPGPQPDRIKLDGSWKDRLARALRKSKPSAGWPKPRQKQEPQKRG